MDKKRYDAIQILALSFSIIALVASFLGGNFKNRSEADKSKIDPGNENSTIVQIKKDGVIRAGYGGYEPYSKLNLTNGQSAVPVTGYSVDVVNEIARRFEPPLKVEWQLINFETMKSELSSGKCDFIIDPIYHTVTRAADFGLTEPYTYVGIGCAVVRKDDNRFVAFKDLDRDDITISVAVAWTSTEFAKQNLSKPKWKEVAVGGTAFEQIDDVINGRADVAIQDAPSVAQYVAAHSDKVKALWLKNPPSMVPAGFLTRYNDKEFTTFLSQSIQILKADGTLKRLDNKWKTYGYFDSIDISSGFGLNAAE